MTVQEFERSQFDPKAMHVDIRYSALCPETSTRRSHTTCGPASAGCCPLVGLAFLQEGQHKTLLKTLSSISCISFSNSLSFLKHLLVYHLYSCVHSQSGQEDRLYLKYGKYQWNQDPEQWGKETVNTAGRFRCQHASDIWSESWILTKRYQATKGNQDIYVTKLLGSWAGIVIIIQHIT